MSLFEDLPVFPPDPVFGQVSAYRADKRKEKVSLLVGYFRDEKGETPPFKAVQAAEKGLELPSEYLPILGSESYLEALAGVVFGNAFDGIKASLSSVQTLGGTGALRTIGDLLFAAGHRQIWVSDPTWPNHIGIFENAQLKVMHYPYHDGKKHGVAFEEMLGTLKAAPIQAAVLLHTSCHNPTGFDLTEDQWKELAHVMKARKQFPIFDFAYQGFGQGVEEDGAPIHRFLEEGFELAVAYTCSKSFALYGERVGALYVVTHKNQEAVLSQLKRICRTSYSNPPRYGAVLVQRVLTHTELYVQWEKELKTMRHRMHRMRQLLVEQLKVENPDGNWDFFLEGNGLFVYSGLDPKQSQKLREEFGIYIPNNGRMNLTAVNEENIRFIASAIASVRKEG